MGWGEEHTNPEESVALLRSELDACRVEIERMRKALAEIYRSGFEIRWFRHIEHVDGCECEEADGYSVEEVDDRCALGDEYPMLVRDDGSYVTWAMRLDQAARHIDDDEGDGPLHLMVGDCGEVSNVGGVG